MNIAKMMKEAQRMQERMAEAQVALASRTIEATTGGGKVKVTATGTGDVTSIKIDPQVVDPTDVELVAGVARTRDGREERAREMAEQLHAVGIEGAYEGALRYVGNPELISRTHFARHLVEDCAAAKYLIASESAMETPDIPSKTKRRAKKEAAE